MDCHPTHATTCITSPATEAAAKSTTMVDEGDPQAAAAADRQRGLLEAAMTAMCAKGVSMGTQEDKLTAMRLRCRSSRSANSWSSMASRTQTPVPHGTQMDVMACLLQVVTLTAMPTSNCNKELVI